MTDKDHSVCDKGSASTADKNEPSRGSGCCSPKKTSSQSGKPCCGTSSEPVDSDPRRRPTLQSCCSSDSTCCGSEPEPESDTECCSDDEDCACDRKLNHIHLFWAQLIHHPSQKFVRSNTPRYCMNKASASVPR